MRANFNARACVIQSTAKAARVAPKNPSVPANIGWVHRAKAISFKYASEEQKLAYADAEGQFRKALELNPKYTDALTGLGWVLQDQADVLTDEAKYHESIETLNKSLAVKEDQPYAHDALGWSYFGLKQYDHAEKAFNRAIALKSDYGDAYYGLGRTFQEQGKTDDARNAYQQAVDNGSSNAKQALDELK